jgi:dCTP deaminase
MYLSDVDIKEGIKKGDITLSPFSPDRLQPASYDIRLGNKFIVNDESSTHIIDPVKKIYAKTREIEIKDGEEFVLHPGMLVLGTSKEYFGSDKYLVQIGGKSSLARIGLMIHNTAGIINPGHFLCVTLELSNQNSVPIIVRPGMDIAQLTFSRLTSSPTNSYKHTGRFAKDNWKHFVPPPARKKPVAKKTAVRKKSRVKKKRK